MYIYLLWVGAIYSIVNAESLQYIWIFLLGNYSSAHFHVRCTLL